MLDTTQPKQEDELELRRRQRAACATIRQAALSALATLATDLSDQADSAIDDDEQINPHIVRQAARTIHLATQMLTPQQESSN